MARMIVLIMLLLVAGVVRSQQLPASSPFSGDHYLFNPAMTAFDREASISARHQTEWLGFTDAPTTTFLTGEVAIKKQPLSVGAFLVNDEFLPLRQTTVGATYAYHLGGWGRGMSRGKRSFSGRRKRGQLSIGLSTAWQQTTAESGALVVNDNDDGALPLGSDPFAGFVVGMGVHYASRPGGIDDRSYGYIGLGYRQLFSSVEDVSGSATTTFAGLSRVAHGNFTLGYQYFNGNFFLRPSIWIDLAENSPASTRIDVEMERLNAYWAGLSYNINQTVSVRLGYSLPFGTSNQLKLGVLGSFNLSSEVSQRGLSYSAYVGYVFGRN